ncbi:stress responsive A/B barrel domain protein [Penicillium waksmanii]|uniref:stress responsive A/B barrel domain protein n=1 Tax=Penicillium waksmanii TaxID=69791 RepID=UPI0025467615|nr:stress responsive A/B barrel domain protein [Penicillium waksmanii]KAJ5966202.1 stress responsive A/B barrel domain protein [Penicillium waksmanii]
MSITHVVLFQFKSGLDAQVIKDVCTRMLGLKDNCVHPSSQRPYIKASSGGYGQFTRGYSGESTKQKALFGGITHAFVVEFENAADRDYYCKEDPVHQEFVQSLGGIIEKAQAIDYTPGVY